MTLLRQYSLKKVLPDSLKKVLPDSLKKVLLAVVTTAAFLLPVAAQAAEGFATANVNMRSGPSTGYPAVTVIPVGTPVEIHGCLADVPWCDVSFYNGRGWVAGRYVQADYQQDRVYLEPRYYGSLGIPTVTFELGNYWDRNYRNRDFYRDRDYWRRDQGDRDRFDRNRPPRRDVIERPRRNDRDVIIVRPGRDNADRIRRDRDRDDRMDRRREDDRRNFDRQYRDTTNRDRNNAIRDREIRNDNRNDNRRDRERIEQRRDNSDRQIRNDRDNRRERDNNRVERRDNDRRDENRNVTRDRNENRGDRGGDRRRRCEPGSDNCN